MIKGLALGLTVLLFPISSMAQLVFSTPVQIYSDHAVESDDDSGVGLAATSSTFVAAWFRRAEPVSPDPLYTYTIFATRSTDAGLNWSSPVVVAIESSLSRFAFAEYDFSVATDSAGNWMTVWPSFDTTNFENDIKFSKSTNDGVSWSAAATLNSSATTDNRNDTEPYIGYSNGNWICAWQSISQEVSGDSLGTDSDILYSVSNNVGATWSNQSPLNHDAAADTQEDLTPRLSPDKLGRWLATWESMETELDEFDNPVPVKSYTMMAWSTNEGLAWDNTIIFTQNPVDASYNFGHVVASDGLGGWITGWANYITEPEFSDTDVIYSHTYNNGEDWSADSFFNHNTLPLDIFDNDQSLSLDDDGSSTWIGVWDSIDENSTSSIFARHSVDGGLTWEEATTLVVSVAPVADVQTKSVQSDSGGAWEQFALRNSVYTREKNLLRGAGFPDVNFDPKIVTDHLGNWVVAWNTSSEVDSEVFFTRIVKPSLDGVYRVFTDFSHTGDVETGGYEQPFKTMASTVNGVATNGIVWIRPSSSPEAITIDKAMTIEAINGLVSIGS